MYVIIVSYISVVNIFFQLFMLLSLVPYLQYLKVYCRKIITAGIIWSDPAAAFITNMSSLQS